MGLKSHLPDSEGSQDSVFFIFFKIQHPYYGLSCVHPKLARGSPNPRAPRTGLYLETSLDRCCQVKKRSLGGPDGLRLVSLQEEGMRTQLHRGRTVEAAERRRVPSPGDLPDPGIEPGLLHCRQTLYHLNYQGSPLAGRYKPPAISPMRSPWNCRTGLLT